MPGVAGEADRSDRVRIEVAPDGLDEGSAGRFPEAGDRPFQAAGRDPVAVGGDGQLAEPLPGRLGACVGRRQRPVLFAVDGDDLSVLLGGQVGAAAIGREHARDPVSIQ